MESLDSIWPGSAAETEPAGRGSGRARTPWSERGSTLVNALLYQVGWFGCVLAAAAERGWLAAALAAAVVAAHAGLSEERGRELRFAAAAGLLGLVLDTVHVRLGVIEYAAAVPLAGIAPLWVVGLWAKFAMLFRFSLRWLSGRYLLSAALGGVGGPLSFAAGARLGAADLSAPAGFVVLAATWALAMPALVALSDRLASRDGRVGRYVLRRAGESSVTAAGGRSRPAENASGLTRLRPASLL